MLNADQKKKLVKLIAPYAPYLAEELWQKLVKSEKSKVKSFQSVHWADWPEVKEKYLKAEKVEIPIQVNGKLRGTVRLKAEGSMQKANVIEKVREHKNIMKYLEGKKIKKTIFIPGELINFVVE